MAGNNSRDILDIFYCEEFRNEKHWSMQCRECKHRITSTPGVNSNFHRHARLKHKCLYEQVVKKKKVQKEQETSELKQTFLDLKNKETIAVGPPEDISETEKYDSLHESQVIITSAVIDFLTTFPTPSLQLLESDHFIKFMEIVHPQYEVPSRSTITSMINKNLQLLKDGIRNDLDQLREEGLLHGNIHVTVDTWSNCESFIGVKFHYFNKAFNLVSKSVAFRQFEGTSENIAKVFEEILSEFGIQPDDVGCVISDNAQNMLKAFALFMTPGMSIHDYDESEYEVNNEILDFCPDESEADDVKDVTISLQSKSRLPCILHSLQLVIIDGLKSAPRVEEIIKECNDVCAFFRRSSYWKEQLTQSSGGLTLLATVPTRWNSFLTMLKRIGQVDVWKAVNDILSQARSGECETPRLTVERHDLLDLIELLECFEEATIALQGEGVTISMVIPAILGIERMMLKYKTDFTDFQASLRHSLHKRFHKIVCQPEYVVATVLDCRSKLVPFSKFGTSQVQGAPSLSTLTACEARAELKKMMDAYPLSPYCEPGDADAASPTVSNLGSQALASYGKIFTWYPCDQEVTDYNEEAAYTNTPTSYESPDVFWARSSSGEKFPRLRWLARHLLSIPASSGSVERLFSISGAIISARRNRLTTSVMESMLMMRETLLTS